ncbi:MAG: type 1 glutamine amidotransferase [Actinobacteria bacterium]|nr:type 1 glutamine amidotransferase [Actinomycetota bacterium]
MSGGLILQFGPTAPPGLLATWARDRGLAIRVHRVWEDADPDPVDFDWIAALGSSYSPLDREQVVLRGRWILERALDRFVPVLGLCFGGQLLAATLGARVELAPRPERGWIEVESEEPEEIPTGPWLSWHRHRFELPAGARELARNEVGVQAFRYGPHLGIQFHPESTVEIVGGWADKDREMLAAEGIVDGRGLLEPGSHDLAAAELRARRLFDGFAMRAGIASDRVEAASASPTET